MLTVPADQCVLLLARGSPSIDDIDVFAYGDDGTVLGADEAPSQTASIIVCPPHPRHVYVAGRVAAGHGIVALSAQLLRPANAERVARAVNARGPGESAQAAEAWPGLEEKLTTHRRAIGGNWQTIRRVALPIDPRTASRITADIDENGCLDVLVVPSDEVAHLDMSALDDRGRIVGRATAFGRERFIVVCSPARATMTFELRPHAGRGLAALLISRSRDRAALDLPQEVFRYDAGPVGPLSDGQKSLAEKLDAHFKDARAVARGQAAVGQRTTLRLELPRGCARLDVIAGVPARGVEAWLWDDKGSLVAEADGGAVATLYACTAGGAARLDVEALAQAGPFAVELRRAPDADPSFVQHPLAAGRLLWRLESSGVVRAPREAGRPEVVALGPTELTVRRATVPVGRCMSFGLAAGAGGVGAELRLVDEAGDLELALVRGTHAALARACALQRPTTLSVRVEMRLAAGSAQGLYATRLSQP